MFTLVTFNTFLLKNFFGRYESSQVARAGRMGHAFNQLKHVDVFVFQEVFHVKARLRLIKELQMDWPYIIWPQRNKQDKYESSGILIMSKHPIQSSHWHAFQTHAGLLDKHASKGILHFQLLDNIQIFALHLQYNNGQQGSSGQKTQLIECQDFITAQDFTPQDTVIIAGDFNIDRDAPEFWDIMNTLKPTWVPPRTANTWVKKNIQQFHPRRQGTQPDAVYDYIFLLSPLGQTQVENYQVLDQLVTVPVSDHFPVSLSFFSNSVIQNR